jgi:hypothetical protein
VIFVIKHDSILSKHTIPVCVRVCDYTWWGIRDVEIAKYYGTCFVEQFSCHTMGLRYTAKLSIVFANAITTKKFIAYKRKPASRKYSESDKSHPF